MIKTLKLFKEYKKAVKDNEKYLSDKYDFIINNWYEFYTTLTLIEAPEEMKTKFGIDALAEKEISTFINKITIDLEKLDLEELVNIYEVKRLNKFEFGITFGFRSPIKLLNNRRIILLKLLLRLLLITGLGLGIFFFI